jgi:hypothetical protein
MFLTRCGSRNAFDQLRHIEASAENLALLCGQGADDHRFGPGGPTVTCTDNAAHHAARVDPGPVAELVVHLIRTLLDRRTLEPARLMDTWYVLVVDGTVQEKCREGHAAGGKLARNAEGVSARYLYVLQISLLGPGGLCLPFMHESIDMHAPKNEKEKEDCEIKAFQRLARRLKAAFPKLPICLAGDALYAASTVVRTCEQNGWKYAFTLKEGRQPTLWGEACSLMALAPHDRLREQRREPSGRAFLNDYLWVETLPLGECTCAAILEGEITPESATLYAWITNVGDLTAARVKAVCATAGRERHKIEDLFNTQKNNGAGLEHVFCAHPTAAKNYYSMMQVAECFWQLFYRGHLQRLYEWAERTTQQGLARLLGESLRHYRLPAVIAPIGQLRFVT